MKTLVPPPITKEPWLKAEGSPFVYALIQNGWNKGQPQMVNKFSVSIQRGFESSEKELEANATLTAAAPAMAEALLTLYQYGMTTGYINQNGTGKHPAFAAILQALLSAGYTEAADQE